MIIDFHTHVYPDKIAERTMEALGNVADVEAHTNGTLGGLLESMERSGTDISVILPVNTRKGQFDSITKFAKSINDNHDNLISFGGIHPDDDDVFEKLSYLKDNGFKGIKIHPDYTETFIDDERYINIIAKAHKLGLLVITHAGKDPAYSTIHCPPDKGKYMLDRVREISPFDEPFFIFAHLGGNRLLSDVEKYLVGENCYIDISCSFSDLGNFSNAEDEDIIRVIKNHGADKILFATDCPWNDQKAYVERFRKLEGISDTEKNMIFSGNARKLLNI